MGNPINTIDILGDGIVMDRLIDRTIAGDFYDDILTTIPAGSFDSCTLLTKVNFPNVTSTTRTSNPSTGAFSGCTSLEEVELPLLTKSGGQLVDSCTSLKHVYAPLLAESGYGDFQNCKSLTSLDLPSVIIAGVIAFNGCDSLKNIHLPSLTTANNQTFSGCISLETITLPKLTSVYGPGRYSSMFRDCAALKIVDVPSVTAIDVYGFVDCTGLEALLLRNTEGICSLAATTAFNTNAVDSGKFFIYVPRALIDTYKIATNWSTYETKFRAIEDYTVDGTTTGEFAFANIRYVLKCVTSSNTETLVIGSYSTILTIKGANPVVSIIMDGVDVTNDVYNEETGEIVIPEVSGDIVITATSQIDLTNTPTLYELLEFTSFNGTSDYIDTGIKLFDTAKDFTIVCSADFSALYNDMCLFHCMNEAWPYPGVSLDGNSGVRVSYTGNSSLITSISNKADVKALALRFKAGALDAIRYKNTSGEIVTVAHNTTAKYTEVTQNLLLGAYQTIAGVKGRYYKGTINSFVVYDLYLDEDMIEYALTVA